MLWSQKSIRIAFFSGLLFAVAINLFYQLHPRIAGALSKNFTQNSWLGGTDTVNTANDTSGNWTKYYSASSGVTAVGTSIKLKVEQSP